MVSLSLWGVFDRQRGARTARQSKPDGRGEEWPPECSGFVARRRMSSSGQEYWWRAIEEIGERDDQQRKSREFGAGF